MARVIYVPQGCYAKASGDETLYTYAADPCVNLVLRSTQTKRRILCHADESPTDLGKQTQAWVEWVTDNGKASCDIVVPDKHVTPQPEDVWERAFFDEPFLTKLYRVNFIDTLLRPDASVFADGRYEAEADEGLPFKSAPIADARMVEYEISEAIKKAHRFPFFACYATDLAYPRTIDWAKEFPLVGHILSDLNIKKKTGFMYWTEEEGKRYSNTAQQAAKAIATKLRQAWEAHKNKQAIPNDSRTVQYLKPGFRELEDPGSEDPDAIFNGKIAQDVESLVEKLVTSISVSGKLR